MIIFWNFYESFMPTSATDYCRFDVVYYVGNFLKYLVASIPCRLIAFLDEWYTTFKYFLSLFCRLRPAK